MAQLGDLSGRLFNKRLEATRDSLYRMAYAWCHNRYLAEDLVQQTLLKALEKRSQLREPDRLESWVYRILANTFRDWHRRERQVEPLDLHEPVDHRGPEQSTHEMEVVLRVRRAISGLPASQRQVLTLVDLEGFSYAETAGVLDVPIGTVMSRLSRARQQLKVTLVEHTADRAASGHLRRVK